MLKPTTNKESTPFGIVFGLMNYTQTCINCKAAEHCRQVGSSRPKTSLAGCEQQCLETTDCQMPEYTTGILQPCKLYNCTQVDERTGSTVVRSAPNSDCLLCRVSKKSTQKGTCFSLESHAYTADMSFCFELCLNHLGCRGATFWNNNTCSLHNCSNTKYERDAIFMERICVDCYYPPAPINGTVELLLEGITTYPGAVATQSCNEGYVLTGNKTIACQANGLWTTSVSCTKSDSQCVKSPVENCSSCKADESCGQHLQRLTGLAKEDCMAKCWTDEVCQLVEYTSSRVPVCSLYNCTTTTDSSNSETVLFLCSTGESSSTGILMRYTSGASTSTEFPTEVASTKSLSSMLKASTNPLSTTLKILTRTPSTTLQAMRSSTVVTTQMTSPIITTIRLPNITTTMSTTTETLIKSTTNMPTGRLTTPNKSSATSKLTQKHLAQMSPSFKTTKFSTTVTSTNTRTTREMTMSRINTEYTVTIIPTANLSSKLTTTTLPLSKLQVTNQKAAFTTGMKTIVKTSTQLPIVLPTMKLPITLTILETRTPAPTRTVTRATFTAIPKLKSIKMLRQTTMTMTTHSKITTWPTMTKTVIHTPTIKTSTTKPLPATKPTMAHTSKAASFTVEHIAEAISNTSPKMAVTIRTVVVTLNRNSTINNQMKAKTTTKLPKTYFAIRNTTSVTSSSLTTLLTTPNLATNLMTSTAEIMSSTTPQTIYSTAINNARQTSKHTTQSPMSVARKMTVTTHKATGSKLTTKSHGTKINPKTTIQSGNITETAINLAAITNTMLTISNKMSKVAAEHDPTPTASTTEENSTRKFLSTVFNPKMTNATPNAPLTKPKSSATTIVTPPTVLAMIASGPTLYLKANSQKTQTAKMTTTTAVITKFMHKLSTIMTTKKQNSTTIPIIQLITKATTLPSTVLTTSKSAESPTTNGHRMKSLTSLHPTISTSAASSTTKGLTVLSTIAHFANTNSFLDDPLNIAVISTILAVFGLGTLSLAAYLHFRHEGRPGLCFIGFIPIRRNQNNGTSASPNSDTYNNDVEW